MMTTLTGSVIPSSPSSMPPLRQRHCFLTAAPSRAGTICSSYGPGFLAAAVIFSSALPSADTLSNIPQTLSGDDCKQARIQHPKSRNAESCTVKCVTTCIRGGAGSPGEGPLNARRCRLGMLLSTKRRYWHKLFHPRPLVVFKPGFRSRQYCLVECSDICNLINDGEDGP